MFKYKDFIVQGIYNASKEKYDMFLKQEDNVHIVYLLTISKQEYDNPMLVKDKIGREMSKYIQVLDNAKSYE